MDIKVASLFFVLLMLVIANSAEAWEIDFSHHKSPQLEEQVPGSAVTKEESSAPSSQELGGFVTKAKTHNGRTSSSRNSYDRQEIVILNTESGFVPSNVRLHKGLHYVVHIVNVNEQKKNVSFIMDAFNQHHATYYGQVRSFELDPDREGIFDYECPETTSVGKLVVFGSGKTAAPTQIGSRANVEHGDQDRPGSVGSENSDRRGSVSGTEGTAELNRSVTSESAP